MLPVQVTGNKPLDRGDLQPKRGLAGGRFSNWGDTREYMSWGNLVSRKRGKGTIYQKKKKKDKRAEDSASPKKGH